MAINPKAKKTRKEYPSYDERITMAEKQISHLESLISHRTSLVEKTEALLSERKAALAKSLDALDKVKAKQEKIIQNKIKAENKVVRQKLSPEERAERSKAYLAKARAVRKMEKEKRDALMSKLKESGKTIDDLLELVGK